MTKRFGITLLLAGVGMVLPFMVQAQDDPAMIASADLHGLQATLEQVYDTMMGKCGELMAVGRGLAGVGALLYVCYRVWGHLARAEPIDFFPLLRPFSLGLVISLYPYFLAALNGLLQPTVAGTAALVDDSNKAIATLLQQKEAAQQSTDGQALVGPDGSGSGDKGQQYGQETGIFSGLTNAVKFAISKIENNIRNAIKLVITEILQLLYEAAALCINTLRTFDLILLAILGPLALGLSAFDGFKHVFSGWLARYINVFLWLPVANIFGSLCGQIQEEMIKLDIQQIQATGDTTFGATDAAYMIFLVIAIVGYFCVPSITNHIISVFPYGGGAHLTKVTAVGKGATSVPAAMMKGAGSANGMGV